MMRKSATADLRVSGLPEIGVNDAQVGNSRPAWREPGIQMHGLCVFLDSGFAACAALRNDGAGFFRNLLDPALLAREAHFYMGILERSERAACHRSTK